MGFWEGETFWKMCSCDSSRGQHIWAKRAYQVRGGRRSSSLNWEHTCLQSSMSGTPTLFLKDRVLCRCRNSEEAKQKRMEKGSCDDLTLRTPLAVSLPVPHQLDLTLLSWLLLREASPSPLTLSRLASLACSSSSSLLLPTRSLLHLALLPCCLPQPLPWLLLPSGSKAACVTYPYLLLLLPAWERRQGSAATKGLVAELTVRKGDGFWRVTFRSTVARYLSRQEPAFPRQQSLAPQDT